jgi:predicted nucleotidyltransferase
MFHNMSYANQGRRGPTAAVVVYFGMDRTSTADLAEHIIGTLRAHEVELRRAGIRHLSLFGSVARGDAAAASDIDLAAEFDPVAHMDLFRLTALERRLGEILGRPVDLLPDPPEKQRLRVNIDRDRRRAF